MKRSGPPLLRHRAVPAPLVDVGRRLVRQPFQPSRVGGLVAARAAGGQRVQLSWQNSPEVDFWYVD